MARTHGIPSTYTTGGCRCDECRTANTKSVKRRQHQRALKLAAGQEVEHGTVSTYRNWMCRCRPCIDAHSAACANYKRNRATAGQEAPTQKGQP